MNKIIFELNNEIDSILIKLKHYKTEEEKEHLLSILFAKMLLKKQNDRAQKEKEQKEREEKEKLAKEKKDKNDLLDKEIKNLKEKILFLEKHKKNGDK